MNIYIQNLKKSFREWRQKNLFNLVNIKQSFHRGFEKSYYSQSGEDVILEKLFAHKKNGIYIDVGAYHPLHYSNTYLLYKKGWHGINIDPNPESIKLFGEKRKRDINIHTGILATERNAPYYVFNHQSCNTFSESHKKEIEQTSYAELIRTDIVRCAPLSTILKQYLPTSKPIDLLTIDVEGHDIDVLKSHNWEAYPPGVIVVEDISFTVEHPEKSAVYTLLHKKGYMLYAYTGLSCIFIK
jgi:FkbM family methyltransferase